MSLVNQGGNQSTYKPLTQKDLEDAFIFLSKKSYEVPQVTFFVGTFGMYMFNLSVQISAQLAKFEYWTYNPARLKNVIYISVYKKEGNVKLKIDTSKDMFYVYNSTILVQQFDSLEKVVNYLKRSE